jgi:hypothetical protein
MVSDIIPAGGYDKFDLDHETYERQGTPRKTTVEALNCQYFKIRRERENRRT